jgi:hypothetical protein
MLEQGTKNIKTPAAKKLDRVDTQGKACHNKERLCGGSILE